MFERWSFRVILLITLFSAVSVSAQTAQTIDIQWEYLRENNFFRDVDWSPDGRSLVAADRNGISLIDATTGVESASIEVPHTESTSIEVDWNPRSSLIAFTDGAGIVFVIDETEFADGFYQPLNVENTASGATFRWDQDGSRLAIFDRNGLISIYDPRSLEAIKTIDVTSSIPNGYYRLFDWSADGQIFAIPNEEHSSIEFFDAEGHYLEQYTYAPYPEVSNTGCSMWDMPLYGNLNDLRWAPNDARLAVGATSLAVCRFLDNGETEDKAVEYDTGDTLLAWSHDGRWLDLYDKRLGFVSAV